jgi:aspartate-semialdehyde dehydrogenase
MEICILGATGLVGTELLGLIARAWPDATLHLFASRAREISVAGNSLTVRAASDLEEADAPRGDLAFVALDDDRSAHYCPRLLELGYRVVDKSNAYRLDPHVPLVVAGVNHSEVRENVRLVANPNCTTIPLTLAIAPIHRRWGIASVQVSTYQAISGAGAATLDEFLEHSKAGYAQLDRLGAPFDPNGYAANVVPHAGKTDDSGFSSEELKLVRESRKILDAAELDVSAQCCRVPVAVGHYEQVWLTTKRPTSLANLETLLADGARAPWVRTFRGASGEGLSSLATCEHRDEALAGRMRAQLDDATGTRYCMTVAADNLRLGAATNAVRAAASWFPSADPSLASTPS